MPNWCCPRCLLRFAVKLWTAFDNSVVVKLQSPLAFVFAGADLCGAVEYVDGAADLRSAVQCENAGACDLIADNAGVRVERSNFGCRWRHCVGGDDWRSGLRESEQRWRQIFLKLFSAHGIITKRLPLGRELNPVGTADARIVAVIVKIGGACVAPPVGAHHGHQLQVRIRYPHVHLDIDGIDRPSRIGSSRFVPEMIIVPGRRHIESRVPARQEGSPSSGLLHFRRSPGRNDLRSIGVLIDPGPIPTGPFA